MSSSISEGSVFTLSNRLSRVEEWLWSQPNRSQVLVLVKALEEFTSSKKDDVEDSGEFDVDEAREPQLHWSSFWVHLSDIFPSHSKSVASPLQATLGC